MEAGEGGLALGDALQNAVVLMAREMVLFRFKQQVSEVLPEPYYSLACQGWQSLQVFCALLPEAASPSLRQAAAKSTCRGGRAALSTYPPLQRGT